MTPALVRNAVAGRIADEADTVRYSIEYTGRVRGRPEVPIGTITGVADLRAGRYRSRVTTFEPGEPAVTDDMYVESTGPDEAKGWKRTGDGWERTHVGRHELGDPILDLDINGRVLAMSDQGADRIRGTVARKVRVRLLLDSDPEPLNADIWIDAHGRLIASFVTAEFGVVFTQRIEVWDLNGPGRVERPSGLRG